MHHHSPRQPHCLLAAERTRPAGSLQQLQSQLAEGSSAEGQLVASRCLQRQNVICQERTLQQGCEEISLTLSSCSMQGARQASFDGGTTILLAWGLL